VGVIALALAAIVLVFVIASLSLDEGEEGPIEIIGAGEVQRQLGGIPQDGPVLGSSEAPVTVEVFSNLQCDPCADYQDETVTPLIEGPVRDGALKLEFHHRPVSQSGFEKASYGAVAAAEQDDEWQFIQLFFINQDEAKRVEVSDDFLDQIANAILNFNVEQWQRDLDAPGVEEILDEDDQLSAERRLPIPAVVVDGPRGIHELGESPSREEIEQAISEVS
jgi:hypothetical protein